MIAESLKTTVAAAEAQNFAEKAANSCRKQTGRLQQKIDNKIHKFFYKSNQTTRAQIQDIVKKTNTKLRYKFIQRSKCSNFNW